MQTIAAIDVGSNAIRLLIGRVDDQGRTETLENVRQPVRLGQDVFQTGQLSETSMQEAANTFTLFRKIIRDHGVSRFRAVSTSALREAVNRDVLIDRLRQNSGIELEVISGEEEARLIHLAVARAVDLRRGGAMLLDIGGGSLEVTLTVNGNILSTESFKMGSVRLIQQLSQPDLPRTAFEKLVREYAESPRRRVRQMLKTQKVSRLVGTGGNVEALGELARTFFKRRSPHSLTLNDLAAVIQRLKGLSYEERIQRLGLRPDRADVILPSAIVLNVMARETGLHRITIPGVGLKDGVLQSIVEKINSEPSAAPDEQVRVSLQRLGRKYALDEQHARHVADLAGRIFHQTRRLHNLEPEHNRLLEAAAYLHDLGHFIGTIDHEKHGAYILTANPIIGLTEVQQAIVVNVVRFHRRQPPSPEEPLFRSLSPKDRAVVIKLEALLRLADGLDTSRAAHVKDLHLTGEEAGWRLELVGNGDLLLEKWAVAKRKQLFCEAFGVNLEVKI